MRRHATCAPTLLSSAISSNEIHVGRALQMITATGHREIAMLGLTFKPDTDDLRDSPLVELAERLIGKGFQLRVFDPSFSYETIVGRNRQFIEKAVPHLATLLVGSLPEALESAKTIVIGHRTPEFAKLPALIGPQHSVIDLAAGAAELIGNPRYNGICW